MAPAAVEQNEKHFMSLIAAKDAFFIKLGSGGEWAASCIKDDLVRLSYHQQPHALCEAGDWDAIRETFDPSTDRGAVTRHLMQLRQFYEASEDTIWITFHSDRLWWCTSSAKVEPHSSGDGSRVRQVCGHWRDSDIHDSPLLKGNLSGKLLAVQGFQGTICRVKESDYLLHKINGTFEPHVENAQQARASLISALVPIIKNLHPDDLEILADLIFRQGGWQRAGVLGKQEKDIDLDLISPITNERIAVQVKSKATLRTFQEYQARFSDMEGFKRFYFVTHSPDKALSTNSHDNDAFAFWDSDTLARQALNCGLVSWLLDKAS